MLNIKMNKTNKINKIKAVLDVNGYTINKKDLSKEALEDIKKQLLVTPKVNTSYTQVNKEDKNNNNLSFKVYSETEISITVPRYFGINNINKTYKSNLLENKINIKFKGALRDYQANIINTCVPIIETQGGGILSLYCGAGKTCLAIYLACHFKLKTLIVVHKSFLQNQWFERIKEFSDARIGVIRQSKTDVDNKDIVIAMLQSMCSRDYSENIFKQFSLVIFDEVHHLGAKVFSQVMFKTGAKYTIGLSATPIRSDGLTKVINWSLGDIIFKLEREKDNRVLIKSFIYDSSHKLYVDKNRYFNGRLLPDTIKLVTNMHKINCRDEFIIKVLNIIRSQDLRKTLVLSGRLDHLHKLKKDLDEEILKDVNNNLLIEDEVKTALYIGGMKDYELDESALADVIFATYDMAKEGLDISKLNTLILATPFKDIEQSIGRILRKSIQEGDVYPLVVDIIDRMSVFRKWADIREKFYKKNDYDIIHHHVWNKEVLSIKEFLDMNKKEIIDNDITKSYIYHTLGQESYEFMKDMELLEDYKCEYDKDLNKILCLVIEEEKAKEVKKEVKIEEVKEIKKEKKKVKEI